MNHLFRTLERRLIERRTYRITPGGLFNTLEDEYKLMQLRDPGTQRNAPKFSRENMTLNYSDMCVRKSGNQRALARAWCRELPEDYLTFCRHYGEYVFAGRCSFHIWTADDVRNEVEGLRRGWDVPIDEPHSLFPFARIVGEPGHFAFRWRCNHDSSQIVILEDYGVVGERDILGRDGDRFVTDTSFEAWLKRMTRTDGYPLIPSKRDTKRAGLKRIA